MIQEFINDYYTPIEDDKHHRYRSWEHVYMFFKANHEKMDTPEMVDHASLHLAFYLASWGMLRGSTQLLKKDYKIHRYFIKAVVANPKYWVFYDLEIITDKKHFDLLDDLIADTKKVYIEALDAGSNTTIRPSDTLISKILMGVYANVPAYDTYFVKGLRENQICGVLNQKSLKQINQFYNNHKSEFETTDIKLPDGSAYPKMKLIDMYFFGVGGG